MWNFAQYLLMSAICFRHGYLLRQLDGRLSVSRGRRQILVSNRHLAYIPDVALHFNAYFDQVQPSRAGKNLVADFSEPKIHRLRSGLEFEIASLPEEYAALESYFRWYKPKNTDLVFDVGAYCGIFTYQLAQLCGRVVAFEPDPVNYQILKRNVARHSLRNVILVNAAISDINGTAAFNSEGALGSSIANAIDRPSSGDSAMVATMSLASACEKYGFPSFIKIDAEGSEIEIIKGATEFIRQNSLFFSIDTNHTRNGRLTATPIEELLRSCDYEAESNDESGFMTTWGRPKSRRD